MAAKEVLCVVVRGWTDEFWLTRFMGTGAGTVPPEFVNHLETAYPDWDVLVPDLSMRFASAAGPEQLVEKLCSEIDRRFNPEIHNKVVLIAYSAGAPLARRALAHATGFNDAGHHDAGRQKPWAARVDRIVYLSGILRGWSISTATPASIRFFSPLSIFFVRTWSKLVHRREPFIWQLRRYAPFISHSRLLDIEREEWCKRNNHPSPTKIVLLGTKDEFISPVDCIELSGSDEAIFAELSGLNHGDMLNVKHWKEGETAKTFDAALNLPIEDLRKAEQANFAIDHEDINDYFDPLDRPGLHSAQTRAEDVTHAVIVLHGIRDEGFWTKRVAKTVKMANKSSDQITDPIFLRAPTPSYGFFSMLDFVRPWIRRSQSEWFLDKYAEVRDCYRNAEVSFVGHSNGTYLAAYALKICAAMRFRNIYFAGSVVRTDFPWHNCKNQVSGVVVNAAGKSDTVIALLPGAMQRLRLRFLDVGGAGFRGFDFEQKTRCGSRPDGLERPTSWLFNKRVSGGHGGGKDESLWQEIADFISRDVLPKDVTQDPLNDGNVFLKVAAVPFFVLGLVLVCLVSLFLIGQTLQPVVASHLCTGDLADNPLCGVFVKAGELSKPEGMIDSFLAGVHGFAQSIKFGWAIITVFFFWFLSKVLRFF